MTTRKLRWGLFCAAMAALSTRAAYAQPDPGEVARRTIEAINNLADRGVENLRTVGQQAARRINALQSEGHQERAQEAARRAIAEIDQMARRCNTAIRMEAQAGINLLRRLDAPPRLIEAVRNAAAEATGRVTRAHDAAVQAVREALRD